MQEKYNMCVCDNTIYISNNQTLFKLVIIEKCHYITKIAYISYGCDEMYNINQQLVIFNINKGYFLLYITETQEFVKIRLNNNLFPVQSIIQLQQNICLIYNHDIMIIGNDFLEDKFYIQKTELSVNSSFGRYEIEYNNSDATDERQDTQIMYMLQLSLINNNIHIQYLASECEELMQPCAETVYQLLDKSQCLYKATYKVLITPNIYKSKMFKQKCQHFIKLFIQRQLSNQQNAKQTEFKYKNVKIELKYLVQLYKQNIVLSNKNIKKIYFNGVSITSSKVNTQRLLYYLKSDIQASKILIILNKLNINYILSEIMSNCSEYKIATIQNLSILRNNCRHLTVNNIDEQNVQQDNQQEKPLSQINSFKQVIKHIIYHSVMYFKDFILDKQTLDFVKHHNVCLLKYAIMSGRIRYGYLKALLQSNVNVCQDKKGLTVVAVAVKQRCIDSLHLLLEFLGTKQFVFLALQVLIDEGNTALCYAIQEDFEEIVTLIIQQYELLIKNEGVPPQIALNYAKIKGDMMLLCYGITKCLIKIAESKKYNYFDKIVQFVGINTPCKQKIFKCYLDVNNARYLDILVDKLGIDGFVEGEQCISQFNVMLLRYKNRVNNLNVPLSIKLLQNVTLKQLCIEKDFVDYFGRTTNFFLAITGHRLQNFVSGGKDIFDRDIQAYQRLYELTIQP